MSEAAIQHVAGYTYRRDGDTIIVENYTRTAPLAQIEELVRTLGPSGSRPRTLRLPEGIEIRSRTWGSGQRYEVSHLAATAGTSARENPTGTPREAAKVALNRSAKLSDPKSIGGTTTYPGLVSATAAKEGPPGELGGGIAQPVEGDKPRGAEGVRAATGTKAPKLTAQDFRAISGVLATVDDPELVNTFANALEMTNPNFDRVRFVQAARGGPEGGARLGKPTARHFELVARTLRDAPGGSAAAAQFADYFAERNPRFKRDRFLKAAGVEGGASKGTPEQEGMLAAGRAAGRRSRTGASQGTPEQEAFLAAGRAAGRSSRPAEPDTGASEKPKPGGFFDLDTGKRGPSASPGGGRVISVKASKNVFEYTAGALIDRVSPTGGGKLSQGQQVRIAKLHGAPAPGSLGHYHVVDAETGELLGMVAYGSLRKIGRRVPS